MPVFKRNWAMGSRKSVRSMLSTKPFKPFDNSVSDAILKPRVAGRQITNDIKVDSVPERKNTPRM